MGQGGWLTCPERSGPVTILPMESGVRALADAALAARGKRTQEEIAARAGLSIDTIQSVEGGHRDSYRPSTRRKLEAVFGWPNGRIQALLGGATPSTDGHGAYRPARMEGARHQLARMADDDLWEMATAVAVASGPSAAIDFVVKAYALRVNETSTVAADET